VPLQEVIPRAGVAARYGWSPVDVLDAVRALRVGLPAGVTWDGAVRVPLRVMLPTRAGAFGTAATMLPTAQGELVPLGDVAEVRDRETPGLLSRQGAQRRLVVGFNVRGAELGDVVRAAQARVRREVPRADGVRLVWGGQYESMQDARRRLGVVIPVTLLAVLGVLLWTFRRVGPALLILLNVPFAGVGGALLLAARGISLSMPAAVGFIALSGIAVLNGVVWMGAHRSEESGQGWSDAARDASADRLRPVLMTALVALLGFVPMMPWPRARGPRFSARWRRWWWAASRPPPR
jgi:cobalt-zinc-cadmium resistance protein CzcA